MQCLHYVTMLPGYIDIYVTMLLGYIDIYVTMVLGVFDHYNLYPGYIVTWLHCNHVTHKPLYYDNQVRMSIM